MQIDRRSVLRAPGNSGIGVPGELTAEDTGVVEVWSNAMKAAVPRDRIELSTHGFSGRERPSQTDANWREAAARFWPKVRQGAGCWEWTGARNNYGYGVFATQITPKVKTALAHRYAWELDREQPVPRGLIVRHQCDNPGCVRPDHLILGTRKDNAQDCIERGRWRKGGLTPAKFADDRRARIAARISIARGAR